MKKEIIDLIEQRLEYLKKWMKGINQAKENIPIVQDMLDRTQLELNVYSSMPNDGEELIYPFIFEEYKKVNELINTNLPIPPKYDPISIGGTAIVSTTSSTGTYTIIMHAGLVDDAELNQWSQDFKGQYYEMQQKQSRFEIIKQKLRQLNPARVIELDEAHNAFLASKNDSSERIRAGICMRNTLEHYKGDLFEKARKFPKENMTWIKMSSALSIRTPSGIEVQTLINQEREWSELHNQLTDIAKKQKLGDSLDLDSLWVKFIDHIYIVLGLVFQ